MMSTNIKYITRLKKSQIYFVFRVQLAVSVPQSHTILDIVVDDEIQFLVGEAVMFGKDTVNFVYNRLGFLNLE